MTSFRDWLVRNQYKITWFLMGWLSLSCINNLAKGNFGWALFDALMVVINYKLEHVRLK